MSDSTPTPPADSAEAEDFDALEFEPVPLRPRHDGWTPERQAEFIQALGESACVAEACRAVGMSERSAYALRARIEAVSFRTAWDAALDYGIRRLSNAVLSRAINGVAVPVFYRGEQVGERRQYNDRLAMFLLRYRDPQRYGKWNDRYEHRGHPEGHALAFLEAKVAARDDARTRRKDIPARLGERLQEMAGRLLDAKRSERGGE